jgi:drug/metabolite transporter (DMT)-like permease
MKMDLGGIAGILSSRLGNDGSSMQSLGTVVPYLCVLTGMRLLTASTSSVIGMLEPVIAGGFAWIWFSQSWDAFS